MEASKQSWHLTHSVLHYHSTTLHRKEVLRKKTQLPPPSRAKHQRPHLNALPMLRIRRRPRVLKRRVCQPPALHSRVPGPQRLAVEALQQQPLVAAHPAQVVPLLVFGPWGRGDFSYKTYLRWELYCTMVMQNTEWECQDFCLLCFLPMN